MEGKVLATRLKRAKSVMELVECLKLASGRGIEGDIYFDDAARAKRQVLLLDKRTLEEFGYEPGILREQILVDLETLQSLEPGTRLSIGSAELEITFDCAPCLTMAGYLGEDGKEFVNKMMGRRGMLARVTGTGTVAPGDSVNVV